MCYLVLMRIPSADSPWVLRAVVYRKEDAEALLISYLVRGQDAAAYFATESAQGLDLSFVGRTPCGENSPYYLTHAQLSEALAGRAQSLANLCAGMTFTVDGQADGATLPLVI